MTVNVSENPDAKINVILDFDYKNLIEKVVEASVDHLECPYECSVEVLLTEDSEIQTYNRESRDIDAPTDVLSFPMLDFETPGDLSFIDDDNSFMYFEPDSGEMLLGDIVINVNRVQSQALEYGHTKERELAFLIAHSMLHLFGFDHMEAEMEKEMFAEQENILTKLGITR